MCAHINYGIYGAHFKAQKLNMEWPFYPFYRSYHAINYFHTPCGDFSFSFIAFGLSVHVHAHACQTMYTIAASEGSGQYYKNKSTGFIKLN